MSSVKKLTIKRGLRSPFSRKSTKKDRDEEGKGYDDDIATTDSKKGGTVNGHNLPVEIRESSNKSRKWPFRGKSTKQCAISISKTEQNEVCASVLISNTNSTNTHNWEVDEPGSKNNIEEKHNKRDREAIEAKCDRESGYSTPGQNGYHAKWDHEEYVTPVRRNQDDENPSLTVMKTNNIDDNAEFAGAGSPLLLSENTTLSSNCTESQTNYQPVEDNDYLKSHKDVQDLIIEEMGAPRLPPKPPSLRGRRISQINNVSEMENVNPPPRPPARQKNRTMGRDTNPPHLRGIAVSETDGQYETVKLDSTNRPGGGLAAELAKLPRQPWYWGPLTQEEAEDKLKKRPDGAFLVRDSSDERYLLSLSFNSHGRTLHTRIEYRNGLFSLNDSEGHASIVELIELAVRESHSGYYGYMRDSLGLHSYPAQLKNWVSRFTEVRPLQHLCRFVIREVYPRHHIQRLPLPKKIKVYILENQY